MASDFQKQKYLDFFNVIDSNQNGQIEFDDMASHVYKLATAKGWQESDDAFKRLLDAKKSTWKAISERCGGSEKISSDEWVDMCDGVATEIKRDGKAPAFVTEAHLATFNSLDLDNSGGIHLDEYEHYLKSMDASTAQAADAFSRADANSDGQVTMEELQDLLVEFFVSDEPGDPGNGFVSGKVYA